jgi:hypothetical protein
VNIRTSLSRISWVGLALALIARQRARCLISSPPAGLLMTSLRQAHRAMARREDGVNCRHTECTGSGLSGRFLRRSRRSPRAGGHEQAASTASGASKPWSLELTQRTVPVPYGFSNSLSFSITSDRRDPARFVRQDHVVDKIRTPATGGWQMGHMLGFTQRRLGRVFLLFTEDSFTTFVAPITAISAAGTRGRVTSRAGAWSSSRRTRRRRPFA